MDAINQPLLSVRDLHTRLEWIPLDFGDPFRDLLIFLWDTGARPQEARHIEPRHFNAAAVSTMHQERACRI